MSERKKEQLKKQRINSWNDVDKYLQEIAVIDSEIQKDEAAYNKVEQERRLVVTNRNMPRVARKQEIELGLFEFVEMHRDELGESKTKVLKHGSVSIKSSRPGVAILGGFTWDKVAELIAKSKKWASQFIRMKSEINKTAILNSASNKQITTKELSALGMVIEAKETIAYKTKLAED